MASTAMLRTTSVDPDDPRSLAPQGAPPEPQPPVPFLLLLLAVSAGALFVLPVVGACDLRVHRELLITGAVLCLPFLLLGAMWLPGCGRAWLLDRFIEGEYSEGATARQLPCLWYPEKVQILEYTTGEAAGTKIETYANWETTAIVEYVEETVRGGNRDGGRVVRHRGAAVLQVGCEVRVQGLQRAPELNGASGTCQQWLADQDRWQVQLQDGTTKNVKAENLQQLGGRGRTVFAVTIPASFGSDLKVTMDSDGTIAPCQGTLPFEAKFDGSAIVGLSGRREGQAWRKAGYWRLDFVTKVLLAMAVVGAEAMLTATVLPPGVVSAADARMPLNAVFLVDGSGSITPEGWQSAMRANKKFITDFSEVYGSDIEGKLNVGFVQFATEAHLEHTITDDMSSVMATLDTMQQKGGGTHFEPALLKCQKLLDDYAATARTAKTFDMCVLITDGEDPDLQNVQQALDMATIVNRDTALFGIFVGNDAEGSAQLHGLVTCGQAEGKGRQDCDFFVSAADFDGLAERARFIAEDVARHSDFALCAKRSALIGGPLLVGLVLPYVLWYLSCCTVTVAKRRLNNYKHVGSGDHLMLLGGA